MTARLNPYRLAPEIMQAVGELEQRIVGSGLEESLIDLVKTRASQINQCAYCIYLHTHEARTRGETEARLYLLNAWRESSLYSARERAALAWTEDVTLIAGSHAPDSTFEETRNHFSDEELMQLTLLIATINLWNRVAISCRSVHPTPQPTKDHDVPATA